MIITLFYGYIFYYFASLIGISIGYHRYFTHNSFKTNKFFEIIFLCFGLICGGQSALTWCAAHRYHHSNSDTEKDPHSPIHRGPFKVIFSQWKIDYIPKKYIVPLMKNTRLRFFHKYRIKIYVTYGLLTLLFGINSFIIFFLSPLFFSWIGFGLLNFFAHRTGKVRDVPFMNIVAPGEGWHKLHHDHPSHYKLHKFDIAGVVIERFFIKTKSSS
jgi:stearoyl-CoA desaturase (Delta-9 desaturase)